MHRHKRPRARRPGPLTCTHSAGTRTLLLWCGAPAEDGLPGNPHAAATGTTVGAAADGHARRHGRRTRRVGPGVDHDVPGTGGGLAPALVTATATATSAGAAADAAAATPVAISTVTAAAAAPSTASAAVATHAFFEV